MIRITEAHALKRKRAQKDVCDLLRCLGFSDARHEVFERLATITRRVVVVQKQRGDLDIIGDRAQRRHRDWFHEDADMEVRLRRLHAMFVSLRDAGESVPDEYLAYISGFDLPVVAQVKEFAGVQAIPQIQTPLLTDAANAAVTPIIIGIRQSEEPLSVVNSRITDVLLPAQRFYGIRGDLVYIDSHKGLVTLDTRSFHGVTSKYVGYYFHGEEDSRGNERPGRYDLPKTSWTEAYLRSSVEIARYPQISLYTRTPVFTRDLIYVATPGYHPDTGIYYDGELIAPAADTVLLNELIAEFCWRSEADRTNYVGGLLTSLLKLLFKGCTPLIVYTGNNPGIGKSILAAMHGLIIDGHSPAKISYHADEAENEKQLATRVLMGDGVIVFDNVKLSDRRRNPESITEIASPCIERVITSKTATFRLLGANQEIHRDNLFTICVTVNHCRLCPDLMRRSLPVALHFDGVPANRGFSHVNIEDDALANRATLLAELAGMIVRWNEAGRPPASPNPAQHSLGGGWAPTIDAILRYNGFEGFLTNFGDAELEYMGGSEEMTAIVERYADEAAMSTSDWVERIRPMPEARRVVLKPDGTPREPRGAETALGRLFSRHLDKRIKRESDGAIYKLHREGSLQHYVYRFRREETLQDLMDIAAN